MSQKPAKTDYKQEILGQLRQPLKRRLLLSLSFSSSSGTSSFFSPLSEQTAATTAKISRERSRVATAREIEQLNKSMVQFKGRAPAGSDANELMRHVIAQLRSSPLKLLDLKPEKSRDLCPYETLGLKLTLEGRFTEIDEFLRWIETDERLLRIGHPDHTPDDHAHPQAHTRGPASQGGSRGGHEDALRQRARQGAPGTDQPRGRSERYNGRGRVSALSFPLAPSGRPSVVASSVKPE
jgi:hypothetical protein